MILASKPLLITLACALAVGVVVGAGALTRKPRDHGHDTSLPAAHGAHHDATRSAVDWTRVSDRDLDIAELFIVARKTGVGDALRKLETLAASDTAVDAMGHVVAHALGRFVVAQRDGDPAVYADCREVFQAGCNHGVMEAYFASPRAAEPNAVEPLALDSLCARITRPGAPRLVWLECAHGMGHGLLTRYHGDVRQALAACDHLTQRESRAECHDGIFMENAVRGTTSADMRVGDAAVRAAAAGRVRAPLVRRGDLAYPCTEVDPVYQSACWKYQAIIIASVARGDEGRTIDACAHAPRGFQNDCFFGIGKQATGWWSGEDRVARLCERVPPVRRASCVAGAVDSYLDEMWTVDRAMAFCSAVATEAKPGCYRTIGSRLAVMRTEFPVIERECARAESGFEAECVKGVALVWLSARNRSTG